jgi:hypothetical protein
MKNCEFSVSSPLLANANTPRLANVRSGLNSSGRFGSGEFAGERLVDVVPRVDEVDDPLGGLRGLGLEQPEGDAAGERLAAGVDPGHIEPDAPAALHDGGGQVRVVRRDRGGDGPRRGVGDRDRDEDRLVGRDVRLVDRSQGDRRHLALLQPEEPEEGSPLGLAAVAGGGVRESGPSREEAAEHRRTSWVRRRLCRTVPRVRTARGAVRAVSAGKLTR